MRSGKHRVVPAEAALHARPIETRPRILLAARCHMLVAGDAADRVTLRNRGAQACSGFVLCVLEQAALEACEFDADREIVAVRAALPLRRAGMPCAVVATDELPQLAAPPDIEMRRHLHAFDLPEVRVRRPVERVGEEGLHLVAAVLA